MINWILPSKKSDLKMLSQIENDKNLLNTIISETIKNINCNTFISIAGNEFSIQDCDVNLGFFTEIYF